MTQIIGCIFRKHAFHVSDRLLTQNRISRLTTFDKNANKTVIFRATDAHVVVGYTGLAFLGGLPTDTFIAQSLLGSDLSNEPVAVSFRSPVKWLDIGQSIERLRRDLTEAFCEVSPDDAAIGLQLSIIGWCVRRKYRNRLIPISWELHSNPIATNAEFQIVREKHWHTWDREICVQHVPEIRNDNLRETVFQQIMDHGGKSSKELKRVLIDGLRQCSEASPDRIGRACIHVELTPALQTKAHIGFIQDTRYPDKLEPFDFNFLPWIVAPPIAVGPSLTCGIKGGTIAGFKWRIENPAPWRKRGIGRVFARVTGQKRRSDPRKT